MSTTSFLNTKRPDVEGRVDPKSLGVDPAMRHLGVGIDTARYGHHVSFLREDKQPACPSLSITESRVGYTCRGRFWLGRLRVAAAATVSCQPRMFHSWPFAVFNQLQQRLEPLQRRFPEARIHLRIDAAGQ